MIFKMTTPLDYNLEIDYSLLMGDWSDTFKSFLIESYMKSLMISLHENYKSKPTYYPEKINIFKTFKDVQFKDLNVVIVNCLPVLNEKSNGLAFGNKKSSTGNFDKSLSTLFDNIDNYLNEGFVMEKDLTLSNWSNQGVLLLNTALTGNETKLDILEWSKFTDYAIKQISKCKIGLVFMFIGDHDSYYSRKVDKDNHTVLSSNKLSIDALKNINDELESANGKDFTIQW